MKEVSLLHAPSQIHETWHSAGIFRTMGIILLVPACYRMVLFGPMAILSLVLPIGASILADAILAWRLGKEGPRDWHAFFQGVLVCLLLPPLVPPWLTVIVAVLAAGAKWIFGSIQSYPAQPALMAWVLARLSWPDPVAGAWMAGSGNGVPGTESLAALRQGISSGSGGTPLSLYLAGNPAAVPGDQGVTAFLNDHVFSLMGVRMPSGYLDLLAGNGPHSVGIGAGVFLLIASVWLLSRRLVAWQATAGMFLTWATGMYIFAGLPFGQGFLRGDVLFFTFQGSFLLALFVAAPDFSSVPATPSGRWIQGLITGGIAVVLMLCSMAPEAPLLAVLLSGFFLAPLERALRRTPAGGRR